eukprot:TCONS_00050694-protein
MEDEDSNLTVQISELSIQLQVAKETIAELESKLESRELELRSTKEKQNASFRRQSRRRKVSRAHGPLIHNTTEATEDIDTSQPLDGYLQLTIFGYNRQGSSEFNDDNASYSGPTFIRMLKGKVFVVGPKGITIGSGSECGVRVPKETNLQPYHSIIQYDATSTTEGKGEFTVYKLEKSRYQFSQDKTKIIPHTKRILEAGTVFSTGNIKWLVSAVPIQKLLLTKAFVSVRNHSLADFLIHMEEIDSWNNKMNKILESGITDEEKELLTKQIVDLNTEEDQNFVMCVDKSNEILSNISNDNFNFRYTEANLYSHFSLLHVAVDYGCQEIVKCLLERKISVNLQCGQYSFTPLHIASKHGNETMVRFLIEHGAELNIKDSYNETAIEKTENFRMRHFCLLLQDFSTACGFGDLHNVQRIFKEEPLCLDAKGYRHFTPLHVASFKGHFDIVNFLLQKGARVNEVDSQYCRTALHIATLYDQVEVIEILVTYGADHTLSDVFGYQAIHFCQSQKAVELLTKGQVSSPLNMAIQIGDHELAIRIIEEYQREIIPDGNTRNTIPSNARRVSRQIAMSNLGLASIIDQKNERGMSPMHIAAASGKKDLLHLLKGYGGSIDLVGGISKWTPLFYAALSGQFECVEFLLAMGANKEISDVRGLECTDLVENEISRLKLKLKTLVAEKPGDTLVENLQAIIPTQFLMIKEHPLLDTSSHLYIKHRIQQLEKVLHSLQSNQQKLLKVLENEDVEGLVELLHNEQILIDERLSNIYPITALDYAASLGYDEIVQVLLDHNANPYVMDSQSYSPLHNAADGGHVKVVRKLLHHGMDVNLQTSSQQFTALHLAALKGHENLVTVLLEHPDIDISLRDKNHCNAFQLATSPKIQKLLARDQEHLYLAVINQDSTKLEELLALPDMSVNATFKDELTLLHIVAERDSTNIAEMLNLTTIAKILIEKGVDINAKGGKDQHTALHAACKSSSRQIAELLLQCGADVTIKDRNGRTPFEVTTTNEVRKLFLIPRNARRQNTDQIRREVSNEDQMCIVCYANEVNVIVHPCKHQVYCNECVLKLEECSLDRQKISNISMLNADQVHTL